MTLDPIKWEATLDRLTKKAEYLKSLLAEINDIDEEVETAERIVADAPPRIKYVVNMGSIMEIANAPAAHFTDEFIAQLERDLPRMLKAVPKPPTKPTPPPNKKSGIITTLGEA